MGSQRVGHLEQLSLSLRFVGGLSGVEVGGTGLRAPPHRGSAIVGISWLSSLTVPGALERRGEVGFLVTAGFPSGCSWTEL